MKEYIKTDPNTYKEEEESSIKEVEFTDLQLVVRGLNSLEESLKFYLKPEVKKIINN
jgi:hypothetical protein